MRLFALAVLSAFLAQPAAAQVYRCTDSSGAITLTDRPCTSTQSGGLVERKHTDEEIQQERMQAAEAMERRSQQMEMQQRMPDQQTQGPQAAPAQRPDQSLACQEARKELEFVSSVRTVSQDEQRVRINAAIGSVNAACGSNTPLMQEPSQVVVPPPRAPIPISSCHAGFCSDINGSNYNRNGSLLIDQEGRACQILGNMVQCH